MDKEDFLSMFCWLLYMAVIVVVLILIGKLA